MRFCDGGGGRCGDEFRDQDIAFEPKFEGGWAAFGFAKDGFSDDVPVCCKHRRSYGALYVDLLESVANLGSNLFLRPSPLKERNAASVFLDKLCIAYTPAHHKMRTLSSVLD